MTCVTNGIRFDQHLKLKNGKAWARAFTSAQDGWGADAAASPDSVSVTAALRAVPGAPLPATSKPPAHGAALSLTLNPKHSGADGEGRRGAHLHDALAQAGDVAWGGGARLRDAVRILPRRPARGGGATVDARCRAAVGPVRRLVRAALCGRCSERMVKSTACGMAGRTRPGCEAPPACQQ